MKGLYIFLSLLTCIGVQVFGQGVIVNEASNGPSGVKEYFELVVVGQTPLITCATVDLRGFVIDDNNGDFSGGPVAGAGIASGHLRFSPTGPWDAIPTGSIILIYNANDKNPAITIPDDPYDLLVPDSVYVIPHNNIDMEFSTCGLPVVTNANYTPCAYASPGIGDWTKIGIANSGDAFQVRTAAYTYFHGVSYGPAPMTGGPDGLLVSSGSGGGRNIFFDNNPSNDFRLAANFTFGTAGTADETPGLANNAANAAWITSLRCSAPVNFTLLSFTGSLSGSVVDLSWKTIRENGSLAFLIQKSTDGIAFHDLISVPAKGGVTTSVYAISDPNPAPRTYYRLAEVDLNGQMNYSAVIEVRLPASALEDLQVYPNPVSDQLSVSWSGSETATSVQLVDVCGRVVFTNTVTAVSGTNMVEIPVGNLPSATYSLVLSDGVTKLHRLVSVQH